MKIAIAGAGMTGAYLYRLLDRKRHTIDIFDRDTGTRCGIKPCAWGTSRGFAELVKASGLDPSFSISFDLMAVYDVITCSGYRGWLEKGDAS